MLKRFVKWFKSGDKGQGMVEYALIIALIAVVLIGALSAVSGKIDGVFDSISRALDGTYTPGVPGDDDDDDEPICSHVDSSPFDHKCDLCNEEIESAHVAVGGSGNNQFNCKADRCTEVLDHLHQGENDHSNECKFCRLKKHRFECDTHSNLHDCNSECICSKCEKVRHNQPSF